MARCRTLAAECRARAVSAASLIAEIAAFKEFDLLRDREKKLVSSLSVGDTNLGNFFFFQFSFFFR